MSDIEITVTNPNGRFALFQQHADSVRELERFDTLEDSQAAASDLLSYDPKTFFVSDLVEKREAYRIAWPGMEKPVEEEPAPKPAAKK